MWIEFDEAKRAETIEGPRAGHGPSPAPVFTGVTLTIEDDRDDYGEVRYMTIGFLDEAMWCSSGPAATTHTGSSALRGPMNENDGPTTRGFDPEAAPDLSEDGWPEKFAEATVRRGRPPKAARRKYRPPSGCLRRSSIIFAREVAAGRHGSTTPLRAWIKEDRA